MLIKTAFSWNCNFPISKISAGHPHNSLRINLLLTSTQIHNFLCDYAKSHPTENLKSFKNAMENPACRPENEYEITSDPYFKKYLKYKNKYLYLKSK